MMETEVEPEVETEMEPEMEPEVTTEVTTEAGTEPRELELDAARQRLAVGLAHEINNPLAYVQSNLCTLSRYVQKITRYTEEVTGAEPLLDRIDDPQVRLLFDRLRRLRAELRLDFVLDDIDALIKESLGGTARIQRTVLDLQRT
jgi:two-component system NtrC family sensor kinase